jgi:hypothetical protein
VTLIEIATERKRVVAVQPTEVGMSTLSRLPDQQPCIGLTVGDRFKRASSDVNQTGSGQTNEITTMTVHVGLPIKTGIGFS